MLGIDGSRSRRAAPEVLLASRSAEAVQALYNVLAEAANISVRTRIIDAENPDPIRGLTHRPDLVLLRLNGHSTIELDALSEYPQAERPPLILIGDATETHSLRAAMRIGARDFLLEPVVHDDLVGSIARVLAEQRHNAGGQGEAGQMLAFINAKGGSGATFLACNIAHLFASESNLETALVDLDLQFGALPQYLDLRPQRTMVEAMEVADELDEVALQAYLTRHDSGVAVMAGMPDRAMLQQELTTDSFETILNLLGRAFDRVVLDLPRQIEPFTALALERAHRIVLVMQQSVPSLHDAVRMYEILTRTLAIPTDRITVVVNRYHASLSVQLDDIRQALRADRDPVCLPNDFRAATESINIGIPVHRHARRSALTKALMQFETALGGKRQPAPRGLLPRLLRTG